MSKNNLAIIEQAKELVPGFREGFSRFKERVTIDQMSPSLLENYGRYLAHVAHVLPKVVHSPLTDRERWILARERDLLNCTYFHVVFTVSEELNGYFIRFPKELYNI